MTIGITGASLYGNKGAEAMASTLIGNLHHRHPDWRFILFTPYPGADAGRPLPPNTALGDCRPAALVLKHLPFSLVLKCGLPAMTEPVKQLDRCDALVDLAGISFSDGREIYLPFNVLTIWPAMLLGKPVAKLAQAMGPFKNPLNRMLAKWLLPRCKVLAARGPATGQQLTGIGVTAPQLPDLAFALNELEDMHKLPPALAAKLDFGDRARPIVGISPSSVVHNACRRRGVDHAAIFAEFSRRLLARGYRVVLLPHSIRCDTDKLKNNDLPVLRAIAAAVTDPNLRSFEDDLASIELRRLIGACRFFVASRYHSMVAALATQVPVMVCGWGHKYTETMGMFELAEWAFDHSKLSAQQMEDVFQRLAAAESDVRRKLETHRPRVQQESLSQIRLVEEMVA
jgi:polysaccharide pyruvyl transferase WcaK-like protein